MLDEACNAVARCARCDPNEACETILSAFFDRYQDSFLSVAERNFILTGDTAFAFDPVPYTVIYDCFTYADIVRGPAPVQPPQVVPNPVQVIA